MCAGRSCWSWPWWSGLSVLALSLVLLLVAVPGEGQTIRPGPPPGDELQTGSWSLSKASHELAAWLTTLADDSDALKLEVETLRSELALSRLDSTGLRTELSGLSSELTDSRRVSEELRLSLDESTKALADSQKATAEARALDARALRQAHFERWLWLGGGLAAGVAAGWALHPP